MLRSHALFRPRAFLVALAMTLFGALPVATASADIGTQNFSFSPLGGSPSGEKPESKLWYHDGFWWGALFNATAGEWRIHRLNASTGQWTSTNTTLDARDGSRADTLMDAATNKLYVASSPFTTSGSAQSAGNSGRVYRYSYNAGTDTYTLDAGFPVTINGFRSETIVIDKDSTGKLWATWTAGSRVYVTHTTTSDTQWVTPYILPGSPTLTSDDISSLVSFGGDKIGVMYSNQVSTDYKFRFAVHTDGAGDAAANWTTQVVPITWKSDDHINLKADSSGRVFAAVKTSESTNTQPLTVLLRRNADGSWNNAIFGTGRDSHTRPIILLDEPNKQVRMYATCPQAPTSSSGQSGGDICQKISSMDNLSFPSGIGTPVIQDTGNPEMNDVTSTKQGINAFSGIVLLANDPTTTDRYWTRVLSIGGTTPPPPPPGVVANFTASPVSGTAPLNVQFTDTSTGGATSWSWDFGDGTTSTAQSPSKTYSAPGTYTVALTASNGTSSNTVTKTNLITVTDGTPPPPPPGGTFTAIADAQVKSTSAGTNYGTLSSLRIRQGTSSTDTFYWSYLKFEVTGLSGPVSGAKLRLYSTDGGPDGGSVYAVSNSWTESGLTWTTRPALGGTVLGSAGAAPTPGFVEINLGNAITGNGTYSFAIATSSSNSVIYDSREGTNPPQLVLPGA
jgi:trimeric autotransporter adhesin